MRRLLATTTLAAVLILPTGTAVGAAGRDCSPDGGFVSGSTGFPVPAVCSMPDPLAGTTPAGLHGFVASHVQMPASGRPGAGAGWMELSCDHPDRNGAGGYGFAQVPDGQIVPARYLDAWRQEKQSGNGPLCP